MSEREFSASVYRLRGKLSRYRKRTRVAAFRKTAASVARGQRRADEGTRSVSENGNGNGRDARQEGILKKSVVFVVAIFVAAFAFATLTACVDTDLSGYVYPSGFEDALSSYDFSRGEETDVRVMSFNILAHMESWGGSPVQPRAKLLLSMLDAVSPDAVAVQEMSSDWHKVLDANLGDEYVVLHPDIDVLNKNKTTIIYNSERLEPIDSGYTKYSVGDDNGCRAVTWGLFTVKSTGRYVIVTSTHFDLVREGQESKSLEKMNKQADEFISKINELYGRYACAVIACGDYNCEERGDVPDVYGKTNGQYAASSVYGKLADALGDIKYVDGLLVVNSDESKKFAPTWDHIFEKGDAIPLTFTVLDDKVFENVSDNYAIVADFAL